MFTKNSSTMGSGCSSNKSQEPRKTMEVPGLKIAVVGDSEVGKSCILDRYINNSFSPLYIPTRKVALRNVVRKLNIPGHATVPITFWDIPGQEELDIHDSYFRNLDAVIVVVDASVSAQIESGKLWRMNVITNATFTSKDETEKSKEPEQTGNDVELNDESNKQDISVQKKCVENLPFLLLGNKKDLIPKDVPDVTDVLKTEQEEEVGQDTTTKISERLSDTQQILEETSLQGFVGSVMVSAKCNDLSVLGAIQNFLRHVLEKRYVERRWRPVEKTPKVKRQRYEFTPQLETAGITQIDEEFSKADEILHRVKSLHNYQDDALAKFAEQCVDIEVIDSTKNASMQNCLVALRKKLDSLDLKLKLVLVDDFYTLEVKANEADQELERSLRYAIKTFNKEYVAVTMAMLKEYPLAEDKLSKIDQRVDALCQQYDVPESRDLRQVPSNIDLCKKCLAIERNRAKIRHTVHECQESMTSIQGSVKQVKAAFVW